jgi:hypothetical protein
MTEITAPLNDLAGRIRAEHEQVGLALRRTLDHAMRCGDLLIEAKAQVSHGGWLPWLEGQCGFSFRTAQAYMRLARNRAHLEAQPVAHLGVREAIALLAEPRESAPPEEATPDDPDWTPEYRSAVEQAAACIGRIEEAYAAKAQLTHEAVANGVPLDDLCGRLGWPLAHGVARLTWWIRYGDARLSGETVPMPGLFSGDPCDEEETTVA